MTTPHMKETFSFVKDSRIELLQETPEDDIRVTLYEQGESASMILEKKYMAYLIASLKYGAWGKEIPLRFSRILDKIDRRIEDLHNQVQAKVNLKAHTSSQEPYLSKVLYALDAHAYVPDGGADDWQDLRTQTNIAQDLEDCRLISVKYSPSRAQFDIMSAAGSQVRQVAIKAATTQPGEKAPQVKDFKQAINIAVVMSELLAGGSRHIPPTVVPMGVEAELTKGPQGYKAVRNMLVGQDGSKPKGKTLRHVFG